MHKILAALKERSWSSRQKITKYILANYKVGDETAAKRHIKMALKTGVSSGALVHTKVVGGSRSFKLSKNCKGCSQQEACRKKEACRQKGSQEAFCQKIQGNQEASRQSKTEEVSKKGGKEVKQGCYGMNKIMVKNVPTDVLCVSLSLDHWCCLERKKYQLSENSFVSSAKNVIDKLSQKKIVKLQMS